MANTVRGLKKLKRNNEVQFEKDKEIIDKMMSGTKIKLMNTLAHGTIVYNCPITRRRVNLDRYKQTIDLNYEQFNALINEHRGLIERYTLMPIGIDILDYEPKDEKEDVLYEALRVFGLDDVYKNTDYLYEDCIDDIILELKYDDFVYELEEGVPINLLEKIVKRASNLVKTKKLNDANKIKYLIKIANDNDDLFTIDELEETDSKIRKVR